MEIEVILAGVTARARLLDDKAPRAAAGLWKALPIKTGAVQVKWSGDAWRTEGDYDIGVQEIENEGHVLAAGDIIHFPQSKKIGVAYGRAEWRNPDLSRPARVSVIGKVTTNVEALVKTSERVWLGGVQPLELRRVD